MSAQEFQINAVICQWVISLDSLESEVGTGDVFDVEVEPNNDLVGLEWDICDSLIKQSGRTSSLEQTRVKSSIDNAHSRLIRAIPRLRE